MPSSNSLQKLPITLVVLAKNESENIQKCLNSVVFANEKIVIDSGSTDNTVELAKECGAKVESVSWKGFGPQRNHGASLAKNQWVVFLDADEEMSEELSKEIEDFFDCRDYEKYDIAVLPRAACYMGKPMRFYRPMKGERLARLYNKDKTQWSSAMVHETILRDGFEVKQFKSSFMHHHSPTLVHKSFKVLKYSELHAQDNLERKVWFDILLLPLLYLSTLFKELFLRCAIGDGLRGVIVAHISANYACYKKMRRYEMQFNPHSVEAGKKILTSKNNWDD